jgi:streptomycin 6-kinase
VSRTFLKQAGPREVEALGLLGPPIVKVVRTTPEGLLLERVLPGESIAAYDDDVATAELALAMQSMWRPVPQTCGLPDVRREARALFDHDLPLAEEARAALERLMDTAPEPVVLHGDLHHGNLLRGPNGWVAIDPHGLVGEPAYDAGPLFFNPLGLDVAHLIERRLDVLVAVLGLDRDRLRRWGFVRAVLSAAWTWEDHEYVDERVLGIARVLLGRC